MQTTARFGPAARVAIFLLTAGLLTALTFGAIAAATQPQLPQPWGLAGNGLIAFDHEGDIFVVQPDGTDRRPLVDTADYEFQPTWSLDGTHLAYWSAERDPFDGNATPASLIVVDADGSDQVVLADGVVFPSPISWSRTGDAIAYSSGLAGIVKPRVHVVATDGSDSRQVGDPGMDAWNPAFSPDGWTLAFMGGNFDAQRGLFLMDRHGNDLRQLSHETGGNYFWQYNVPRWSPDGAHVLVNTGSNGRIHTRSFRVDGLHEIDVTDVPGSFGAANCSCRASWSPAGESIAYLRTTDKTQLAIVRPDGTDVRIVEGLAIGQSSNPIWSPDGSRLLARAHLATDGSEAGLVIVDPEGAHASVGIPADGDGGYSWQRVAP